MYAADVEDKTQCSGEDEVFCPMLMEKGKYFSLAVENRFENINVYKCNVCWLLP